MHDIQFSSSIRGRHQLVVSVNDQPIAGSPFPVYVKIPPTQLGKPVRIIGGLNGPGYDLILIFKLERNILIMMSLLIFCTYCDVIIRVAMVPVYVCARLCLHANTKKLIMRLFPQLHVVSQARLDS